MTPSQPIVLPVEAKVTITDPRTGTTIQASSHHHMLEVLRQRHRNGQFVIGLQEEPHNGQISSGQRWTVEADTITGPHQDRNPDYLVHYHSFRVTTPSGDPRPVTLSALPSITQQIADHSASPVEISTDMFGFDVDAVVPAADPSLAQETKAAVLEDRGNAGQTPEAALVDALLPDEAPDNDGPATVQTAPSGEPEGSVEHRSTAHAFATRQTTRRARVAPAEAGWKGALNRAFLLKLKPGRTEQEHRQLRSSIQRGLGGHRTATVLNIKGGVGKSTKTFLLGATLGRTRGGNILAWDNNENSGNLADRGAPARHSNTALDLFGEIDSLNGVENADKLVRYVRPQGDDRFDVLASQNEAGDKETIDADAFRQMHRTLSTFFSHIIVDTGNASNAKTWQAAVDIADVLVIAATNKEDGARRAFVTVDALRRQGHTEKLANSVALITQPQRPSKERLTHMIETLRPHVREVITIPWDPALDEGGTITWEVLAPETRVAYLKATAAIVEGM